MEFKQLLNDDDAVSPVIGVILMVAITVILAAVIGTFVLGLGDQVQETAPNAQFSTDYDTSGDPALTITHDGGSTIPADRLTISGNNHLNPNTNETWIDYAGTVSGDSEVAAGDQATVTFQSDISDNSARVIWTSEGGGRTATLTEWEA
ncbi:type IV pilin N-terminal domain-containing protein [Natronomonas halophila]|uniref:type IV pilin n=1 Tax=Natronomonas halophila TaxID=2747817 RepID=UPI0015B6EDF2|nr:type IV pilin N-terminal domain-containing protein [Natronomonas halophila]QLD84805.1 type IV pilin N-terminal domain-containing protein [Natronomonas halophila]